MVNKKLITSVGKKILKALVVLQMVLYQSVPLVLYLSQKVDAANPPIVNAGTDKHYNSVSDTKFYDVTYEIDPTTTLKTLQWSFVSSPVGSTYDLINDATGLSDYNTQNPTFVADTDGKYELSLTITDSDDVSTTDNVDVYVDNVSPVLTTVGWNNTNSTGEYVRNTKPVYVFNSDELVTLDSAGGSCGSVSTITYVVASTYNYEVKYSNMPTGSEYNDCTLTVKDYAGNSSTMNVDTVKVDNVKPEVDLINSPLNGSYVKGLIDISSLPSDEYSGMDKVNYRLDPTDINKLFSVSVPDADGNYVYSNWDTKTTTDGEHTMSIRPWDVAGNGDTTSYNVTFYVDNTPPVITLDTTPQSDSTPTIVGTINEMYLDKLEVTINGKTYTANMVGTDWNVTLPDTDALLDNNYVVVVDASDKAGNTSSVSGDLLIDTTPPYVYAGPDVYVNDGNPIEINGAEYDAMVAGLFNFGWFQSGGSLSNWSSTDDFIPTFSATEDGVYTLYATVTDKMGRTSMDDMKVIWDTTAPAVGGYEVYQSYLDSNGVNWVKEIEIYPTVYGITEVTSGVDSCWVVVNGTDKYDAYYYVDTESGYGEYCFSDLSGMYSDMTDITIVYYIKDKAGNLTEYSLGTYKVDGGYPSVTPDTPTYTPYTGPQYFNNEYNSDKDTISTLVVENGSGIAKVTALIEDRTNGYESRLCWNGTSWVSPSGVPVPSCSRVDLSYDSASGLWVYDVLKSGLKKSLGDGHYYWVTYVAEDNLGYQDGLSVAFYWDEVSPKLIENMYSEGSTNYTNNPFKMAGYSMDSVSGMKRIVYRFNSDSEYKNLEYRCVMYEYDYLKDTVTKNQGYDPASGEWMALINNGIENGTVVCDGKVTVIPDGEYYVELRAFDNVNNMTKYQYVLVVDNEAPVMDKVEGFVLMEGDIRDLSGDIGDKKITDNRMLSNFYLEISSPFGPESYSWDISGYGTEYNFGNDLLSYLGGSYLVGDTSLLPEGEYKFTFYGTDMAGNQSSSQTVVIKIENEKPYVETYVWYDNVWEGETVYVYSFFYDKSNLGYNNEGYPINYWTPDDYGWEMYFNPGDGSGEVKVEYCEWDVDCWTALETETISSDEKEMTIEEEPVWYFNYPVYVGWAEYTYDYVDQPDENKEYNAYLKVCEGVEYGGEGECTTNDFTVTVWNNVPMVDIVVPEGDLYEGNDVVLNADVTYGNEEYSYLWSCDYDGDDTELKTLVVDDNTGSSYSIYTKYAGWYSCYLTITDSDGDVSEEAKVSFEVKNVPVELSITADPSAGVVEGTPVKLTANVTSGNAPYKYEWSGDCSGTESTYSLTEAQYKYAGTYTCKVTVTDDDGDVAEAEVTVSTSNNAPSVIIYSNKVNNNGEVVADNGSIVLRSVVKNGNSPYTYVWGGDCSGNTESTALNVGTGAYYCSVTVTDVDGDTARAGVTIVVNQGTTTETEEEEENQENGETEENEETEGNGEVLGEETQRCDTKVKLSGYLYEDKNGNNTKDEGEKALEGVKVYAKYTVDGKEYKVETKTNADGYYEMNVCPDDYKVEVDNSTLPKGYKDVETENVKLSEDKTSYNLNIGVEKEKTVLDYWWIAAIVVGVMALGGVIYVGIKSRKED